MTGGCTSGASTSTTPTLPTCDGAGATSSATNGHVHEVCIPGGDLSSPPANATYTTTSEDDHTHDVQLSQAQLQAIGQGEAVVVETTVKDGHTHSLSLQRESSGKGRGPY